MTDREEISGMPFMEHKGFSDHHHGKPVITVEHKRPTPSPSSHVSQWSDHHGKRMMTVEQFKLWLKTEFDTNSDGKISKEELRHAVRLTRGLFASWGICLDFYPADTNHNGFIDDNEFKNLVHFADKHFNVKIKQS